MITALQRRRFDRPTVCRFGKQVFIGYINGASSTKFVAKFEFHAIVGTFSALWPIFHYNIIGQHLFFVKIIYDFLIRFRHISMK